jgi:S-adenosylmethionine-diacylgycerolhomoserine-N-methlytransferase
VTESPLGCGTARNLVLLAGRHELVSFYGVDASSAMLGTARAVLARRGLGERVRLERGLAEAFDRRALFGLDEPFDDVLFSYALSMIGPWRAALDRALAALRPGGTLHVVDFGAAEGLPPLLRRAMRSGSRPGASTSAPTCPATWPRSRPAAGASSAAGACSAATPTG